jgi:hypothetical protein
MLYLGIREGGTISINTSGGKIATGQHRPWPFLLYNAGNNAGKMENSVKKSTTETKISY